MKKIIVLFACSALSAMLLFGQDGPPQAFSYKATIKDSKRQAVVMKKVNMRVSIIQGNPDGVTVYTESFTPTTNHYSQIDVEIGRGEVLSGIFSAIDWSAGNYFLKVEVDVKGGTDYETLSVTQLLSVPYALYAGYVTNPDGDGDPRNELQNLVLNGHELSIEKGNTVTLPDEVNDADHDPGNEIQQLSLSNDTVFLSNGGYIKLPDQAQAGWNYNAENHNIINLADPVNDRDAATKAYVDALERKVKALEEMIKAAGLFSLKDADGNTYNVVSIGSQIWMAENLKTTRFNDGSEIPLVKENSLWGGASGPAYCWYNNDEAGFKDMYGGLYNWYAVNTGKLCPSGWHVPTDAEWTVLDEYLVANGFNWDNTTAGQKTAKSLAATSNWVISDIPGAVGNTDFPEKRNISGFTALPGGGRNSDGSFSRTGYGGYWWSSSEASPVHAWYRYIYFSFVNVIRGYNYKLDGFSVRCVKD
mgnify:CR=1 FL=1